MRSLSSVSWEEAQRHVDERIVVEGTIVRTHRTQTMLYLKLPRQLEALPDARHPREGSPLFPPDPENAFMGKKVRARGEVVLYKGRLEMIVRDPGNLAIVQ